ncbi:putative ABC transporter ATP-binding protein AlbC [Rubripirellula amarantea]|uniref:Putative ABC transporter ATP-binding protein AlbC n=1 Tax=Rubripirellula amarantea TaxID=2527999 RepID=A0A5C5WRJ1_9BACT|nr:ABC transporter ATP-binding protein [Rubripirellula amarantea]TWT53147.1 putative ABC transporter ATP-binding protein AlbC [Rubripirellula amarantea]
MPPSEPNKSAINDSVIKVNDVHMHFRRTSALQGVNLTIEQGTVFALLGENGAGKTTLIRILTGFQMPTSGSVTVCGLHPAEKPDAVRRQIGYVSDAPSLYPWMTVDQIGGFAASLYDQDFLPRFRSSIADYAIDAHQKIKHLSKGQRAKVALSLALAHDPSLLILDEPTSGLDPKVRKSFLESMIDRAATGQTVFLSSHQISEVERVADRVAILHHGKIVLDGTLEDIRQSVFHIIVEVDDPLRALPALPSPAVTLSEETRGRSRQWLVRNVDSAMISHLRSRDGVTQVHQRTATLEETFVAYTSSAGDLGKPPAPPNDDDGHDPNQPDDPNAPLTSKRTHEVVS